MAGGVLDFLFNGQAPPSVSTYGTQTQNVPQWLSDYTQGVVTKANAVGAEPYQLNPNPRIAAFSPDTQSAFDMTRQNAGAYQPTVNNAISTATNVPGQAAAGFNQANQNMNVAGGLTMAGGLGRFTGSTVDQYMNPYIGNVIDRSAQLANRNFSENMMPSLNSQFVSAGQPNSGRHELLAMRGARDVTQNIQDSANSTLANAYSAGQGAFQNDASRMLQSGQQMGALGSATGALANQQGQLGLDAAARQAALATTGQQMGVTDAAQMAAIGNQQEGKAQQNLDVLNQDWQNQVNYPKTQLNWMADIVHGMPMSSQSTNTTTGPGSNFQPSPLAQLGAAYGTYQGLSNLATGKARGGVVRRYARGGLAHVPTAAMLPTTAPRVSTPKAPTPRLGALVSGRNMRRALGVL